MAHLIEYRLCKDPNSSHRDGPLSPPMEQYCKYLSPYILTLSISLSIQNKYMYFSSFNTQIQTKFLIYFRYILKRNATAEFAIEMLRFSTTHLDPFS